MNYFLKIIVTLVLLSSTLIASDLKKVTLQLSWFDQFQFAGYYMAKEKGYYRQLGLDVEIRPFKFGIDIPKDVHDNTINFAVGRETLILERANNRNIVALYALFQSSPLVLLSTKESNINTISDFVGKKIMTTIDDAGEVSLKAMISSNNVKLDNLNFIKHTHNINDLVNKNTDVISAYISKSTFELQKMDVKYNVFNPSDYGFDMYSDLLYTSETLIENDPDTVQKFREASLRGWEYAYSNIEESVTLVFNDYNSQKISKEALLYEAKELKKLSYYNKKELGNIDKNKIQRISDLYGILGLLKQKINFDRFVYDENIYKLKFTQKEQNYLEEKKSISLCIHPNSMPYENFNEKNQHIGLISDYFNLFKNNLSIPIKLIPTYNLSESINYIDEKKCDLLSKPPQTSKIELITNLTQPFLDIPLVLATKLNVPFIDSLSQINNKKIAFLEGSITKDALIQKYPNLEIIKISSVKYGLEKVSRGEVFGLVANMIDVGYILQNNFIGELKIAAKFKEKDSFRIAVRSDDNTLLSIFNKIISKISDHEKQSILNANLAIKYESGFNYNLLWKLLIVIFIIFIAFTYRQIQLKRLTLLLKNKVNDKTKELQKSISIISENVNYSKTNKEGIITEVSRAFCEDSQYTKKELLGEPHSIVRHPDMDPLIFKELWDTIQSGKVWKGKVKALKKDKSFGWSKLTVTPEFDDNNKIKGYIAIRHDVTSKELLITLNNTLEKRIKEEVEENRKKDEKLFQQSKMVHMGEMIGNIAHQWRQPLSVISVAASGINLKRQFNILKEKDMTECMDSIVKNTKYLSQTIDIFRDYTKQSQELKNVVLQEKIDITLNIISETLKNNDIEVRNKINYNHPIRIDLVESDFSDILISIIHNAKDALFDKNIEDKWIKISLEEQEEHVVLSIEDNAKGIPQDIIDKVFHPYFTTKHQAKGIGLGLNTSYKLVVEKLKGNLSVENTINGAKFSIELPKIQTNSTLL